MRQEIEEITRGALVRLSAIGLTVGALREVTKRAPLGGVTGVEFTDTGHPVPFRLSVRQLREVLEKIPNAQDADGMDLGFPAIPGQRLH